MELNIGEYYYLNTLRHQWQTQAVGDNMGELWNIYMNNGLYFCVNEGMQARTFHHDNRYQRFLLLLDIAYM